MQNERKPIELTEFAGGDCPDVCIVEVSSTKSETPHDNDAGDDEDKGGYVVSRQAAFPPTPLPATWPLPFKPDSGFSCVDALRTIAVIGMVVKNAVQRFTTAGNPVAKALGAEWVSPLFVFAAGCRLASEQHHLNDALRNVSKRRARRLKVEAALKQYVRLVMILIYAVVYVAAVFGPLRVCAWDILVTIALSIAVLYPIHRLLPPWALLIFPLPIFVFSPVLFSVADGKSYWNSLGFFLTNWNPGPLAGSMFLWGPTPLFPFIAFAFLGDAITQLLLSSPTVTYQRRAALGFVGLVVALCGLELHLIGERRGPFVTGALSFIFPKFSIVPLVLSWSLVLSGSYVMSVCMLSIILDPIHERHAPLPDPRRRPLEFATAKAHHEQQQQHNYEQDGMIPLKRFLARCSRFTMSIYIAHVAIIMIPLRIAGDVLSSDADAYVTPPGTAWRHSDWIADLFLAPAGVLLFVLHYLWFYAWDRWGKAGVGTLEWMMSWTANHVWNLVEKLPWISENADKLNSRLPSFFIRP